MKNGKLLLLLGAIPAIWLGLLTAPYLSEGLPGILEGLPVAMQEPYKIVWCEDSGKAALLFLALYGMGVGIYLSTRRHYRKGEEHGSAKWGMPGWSIKSTGNRIFFKTKFSPRTSAWGWMAKNTGAI